MLAAAAAHFLHNIMQRQLSSIHVCVRRLSVVVTGSSCSGYCLMHNAKIAASFVNQLHIDTNGSCHNDCAVQVVLEHHLQRLLRFQPVKKLPQQQQLLLLLASVEQHRQQLPQQVMQPQLQRQQQPVTQPLLQLLPQLLVPMQLLRRLLQLLLQHVDQARTVQQHLVLQQLVLMLLQLLLLLPWLLLQVPNLQHCLAQCGVWHIA